MTYKDLKTTECSCDECKSYCRYRVGWPTPQEATALMNSEHKTDLMLDYWVGDDVDIEIVAPAKAGYEGCLVPYNPRGHCTFLTEDEMCQIHDNGHKPIECRLSDHEKDIGDLHEHVSKLWDTDEGRAIVAQWREDNDEHGAFESGSLMDMFSLF